MPRTASKKRSARSPQKRKDASLQPYYAKRDLQASGEPGGNARAAGSAATPQYVIQKHDATRLHYDLRLEMNGLLKSWAVPKGLPTEPGSRSLAVEVEDHPLDYGDFEGVIPKGNYGAGTVMLWDRGRYTVGGGDPARAYREGKIHFALAGEKCFGEWTLVRLRDSASQKTNWLVIKNRDRTRRAPIKRAGRDRSVKTGRSLHEIATDKKSAQWTSSKKDDSESGAAVSKSSARKPAARTRPASAKESTAPKTAAPPTDASVAKQYVEPMKALGVKEIPPGDWLLEIKFDGYRALALLHDGGASLWSRNRNDLSPNYPEIIEALREFRCRDTVIDGEIVALDDSGRPRFQLLQGLEQGPSRPPIFFYVFDLLRLDGQTLLHRPIEERKRELERLLKNGPAPLRLSPVLGHDPAELLEHVREQGLEGIVAKQAGSRYEPGRRGGAWLKCRIAHEQEFVIGGYTPPGGSRPHFGAILVGYYEKKKLLYAGKVGTGFDAKRLAELKKRFTKIATETCPFANLPMPRKPRFGQGMTATAMREVTWLKPELVAQIRFSEWTREGILRQPVFLGLRTDKAARDVVREV